MIEFLKVNGGYIRTNEIESFTSTPGPDNKTISRIQLKSIRVFYWPDTPEKLYDVLSRD